MTTTSEIGDATAIAPNVFRLGGSGSTGYDLRHHSYLLRLTAQGTDDTSGVDTTGTPCRWLWVDPGTVADLPTTAEQASRLMGGREAPVIVVATGLAEASVVTLPAVLEQFPASSLLMNFETWNFLAITGVPEERVRLIERFRPGLHFPDVGRSLQVIAMPYAQFTGSLLLFEPESGCLVSGELLASEAPGAPREDLYARDGDWTPIRRLQERKMPCNAALQWTLDRVERLRGLRQVCPLSGPLLRDSMLTSSLTRLKSLPVGADLLRSA